MDKKKSGGSKISNTEWELVIGAAAFVDIIQVVLDILVVGLAVNRFIDLFMGFSLGLYFKLRGVRLDAKKLLTLVATFIGEEVPILDATPLWSLDVVMTMGWDKADKLVHKVPGGSAAVQTASGKLRKPSTDTLKDAA